MDRHALLEKTHLPNHSNRSVHLKKSSYRPHTSFIDPFLDESTNVHQLNASALLAGFSLPHSRMDENTYIHSHKSPKGAATSPGNPSECLSHTHSDPRREVRFKPSNVNLGEDLPEEEEITPALLLNIHRRDSRSPNVNQECADCVSQCFEDEDVVDGPLGPSHTQTSHVVRTRENPANNSSCAAAVSSSCSKEATVRKQSAPSITSAASIKSVRS